MSYLLIASFLIVCLNPAFSRFRLWLTLFLVILPLTLTAELFIPPGFDHLFYLDHMHSLRSVNDALTDSSANRAPLTSICALVWNLSGNDKPFLVVNSIAYTSCLVVVATIFDVQRPVKLILIPFFFPVVLLLLVTFCKDILIALATLTLVALLKPKSEPIKALSKQSLIVILLASASILLISNLRQYFLGYIILALTSSILLYFAKVATRNSFVSLVFSSFFFWGSLSAIVFVLWGSIRRIVSEYQGNAVISLLSNLPEPNPVTSIVYPLLTAACLMTSPAWVYALENISILKASVGFWEGGWFTIGFGCLIFVLISNRSMPTYTGYIAYLAICHIVIQSLGSPNIGSLHRLLFVEKLLFIGALSKIKIA